MGESSIRELLSIIDNQIKTFEEGKFLKKNRSRNLGIIYTPNQIVDYIVSNTFRLYFEKFKILKEKIKEICDLDSKNLSISSTDEFKKAFIKILKNLRILDPSCGSGRFLISVAKKLHKFYQIAGLKLSDFELKKYIIQNNIFGIDIENSAILISKLRLIRWLLSSYPKQFVLQNIDFENLSSTNIDQIIKKLDLSFKLYNEDYLLAFNLNKFHIIIGNPPYIENKKIKNNKFKINLTKRFKTTYRLFDLSIPFIEKSLELLEINGYLSFILPNKFLAADYGIKLRMLLLNESDIKEIINISSLPIFQKTATYPIILIISKSTPRNENEIVIKISDNINKLIKNNDIKVVSFNQNLIEQLPSKVIPIFGNVDLIKFLYENYNTFEDTYKDLRIIYRPFGFLKYSKHFENVSEIHSTNIDLLLLGTGNIGKYYVLFDKRIKIAGCNMKISYFNYHPKFKEIWTDLNTQKVIFREIAKDLTCFYDSGIFCNITGLYFIKIASFTTDQFFSLLTILNSDLLNLVFKTLFGTLHMAGGYLRFNGSFIKRLPMLGEFPLILSQLGKIIQLLSQLKYDLSSGQLDVLKIPEIKKLKTNYTKNINNYLLFFNRLSNSIVNLLYLDSLYLESDLDYKSLRELSRSTNVTLNFPFKFILPRYLIKNYKIYQPNELVFILSKIEQFYNDLINNKNLLKEIGEIIQIK
ncbi:MAG: class I SAM-dependent DNA methyltransferase [Promethearchaeota archaeon]